MFQDLALETTVSNVCQALYRYMRRALDKAAHLQKEGLIAGDTSAVNFE